MRPREVQCFEVWLADNSVRWQARQVEPPPYRELFVGVFEADPCPWCQSRMKSIDEDGGVRCEHCGARSLALEVRKTIAAQRNRRTR